MGQLNFEGTQMMLNAAQNALNEWREAVVNRIPPGANETRRLAEAALAEAQATIIATAEQVVRVGNDDTMYPAGRRRIILAALEQAGVTVEAALSRLDNAATVLRAQLDHEALPRLNPANAAMARTDATMILDRADGDTLPAAMARLAQRNDDVGALVVGQWGRDYLSARQLDGPLADAVASSTVASALEAARDSGDPTRTALAEASGHIGTLLAAGDAVAQAWRHAADAMSAALPAPVA